MTRLQNITVACHYDFEQLPDNSNVLQPGHQYHMAGALYYKKHSFVFVIDIYVVIMRFITVKKSTILIPSAARGPVTFYTPGVFAWDLLDLYPIKHTLLFTA